MANKEGHVEGVPRVRGLRYELISYFDKSLIAPCMCVCRKNLKLRLNPQMRYL